MSDQQTQPQPQENLAQKFSEEFSLLQKKINQAIAQGDRMSLQVLHAASLVSIVKLLEKNAASHGSVELDALRNVIEQFFQSIFPKECFIADDGSRENTPFGRAMQIIADDEAAFVAFMESHGATKQ
jgi:N-acetylglucosamine kinase-like BadF-type ATPase